MSIQTMTQTAIPALDALGDAELASLAAARDLGAIRLITSRNNQRLLRAAWSVLKNRTEAEDAVQEAYLKAFRAIGGFKAESSLSTWLTRIALNEAIARKRANDRRARHLEENDVTDLDHRRDRAQADAPPSPEAETARAQVGRLLEGAVARLPDPFRSVFVLRAIEDLSVEDTATALGIPQATVKTRLLRARRRLRQDLDPTLKGALADVFVFAGADCERLTLKVLAELAAQT